MPTFAAIEASNLWKKIFICIIVKKLLKVIKY